MEYTIDIIYEMLNKIVDDMDVSLFKELNGGILLINEVKYHKESVNNDLVILGEYNRYGVINRINIYYGSIIKIFYSYSEEEMYKKLEEIINHELRHHLEHRLGSIDLEIEDFNFIEKYKNNR